MSGSPSFTSVILLVHTANRRRSKRQQRKARTRQAKVWRLGCLYLYLNQSASRHSKTRQGLAARASDQIVDIDEAVLSVDRGDNTLDVRGISGNGQL